MIMKLDKSITPEWLNSFLIAHRQGSLNLCICLDLKQLDNAMV